MNLYNSNNFIPWLRLGLGYGKICKDETSLLFTDWTLWRVDTCTWLQSEQDGEISCKYEATIHR